MAVQIPSHAEQIAFSAACAAWAGAGASTFASVVALSVAVTGARREAKLRRKMEKEQQSAFCFGMIGALEMLKTTIADALAHPDGAIDRHGYVVTMDHVKMVAEAGLAVPVFDLQMLRDAYGLRRFLTALDSLAGRHPGDVIPNAAVRDVLRLHLVEVLAADDRFFKLLPSITQLQGVHGRTPIDCSLLD